MNWDEIYLELKEKLGRCPRIDEVYQEELKRIFEQI